MASPMNWFRKYQKVMLVVFGVLLMVVFLLPQLGNFSGNRVEKADDPVLVKWNGGSLRGSQLERMRMLHFQTVRFLDQLQQYAAQKKGRPIQPLVPPIDPLASGSEDYNEERADEEMLNRYLCAEEARKLGVVVSDEMVNDYVAYSGGEVELTDDELREIIRSSSSGYFSLSQIKEHLKLELACRQFEQMAQTGVQYFPNPVSAAQLYRRAASEMECTVYPVVVADFLPNVDAQPTEADLMTLFEQGRYQLPDPTLQEPGFKVPRKINVQYAVAEFETFLQNEINKLTDAEVQAEYDRLVAAKDPSVMELVDEADSLLPGESPPPDAAPEAPPAGEGDGGTAPAGTDPAPTAPTTSGQDDASGDAPSAGDEASKPEGANAAENPGEGDGDGQAGFTPRLPGQFAFLAGNASRFASGLIAAPLIVQDEAPATQDPKPESESPAPTADAEKAADSPASEPTAGEQQPPSESGAAEAAAPDPAPSAAAEQPATDPAAPPQTPEPEKRPRPLKDVADQIKRQLKSEPAREAMRNKVLALEEAVREYQQDLLIWESVPEEERDPKPSLPDFARMAADNGLQFSESKLVDEETMKELPIGKLFVFFQQRQILTLSQILFGTFETLRAYDPKQEQSFQDGNLWLYWVQETRKVETRSFSDARADVVAFWKMRQARNMARAKAENIVEEINSSGQQLNQKFGDKAVNTGAFSWFAGGQNDFGLGKPLGVEAPSDEFMQVASGLEIGKAGYAADLRGDRYYVIQRIAGDRRSPEEMTENFIQQVATEQSLPIGVRGANQSSVQETRFDYMDRFLKDHRIEWVGR